MRAVFISIFALSMGFSAPAFATGGVHCEALDGRSIGISIGMGRLPVMNVLQAYAWNGSKSWGTNPVDDMQEFYYGQGMMEPDRLAADFTDTNLERIIISLRVDMRAEVTTKDDEYTKGMLTFEGMPPIPVKCAFE